MHDMMVFNHLSPEPKTRPRERERKTWPRRTDIPLHAYASHHTCNTVRPLNSLLFAYTMYIQTRSINGWVDSPIITHCGSVLCDFTSVMTHCESILCDFTSTIFHYGSILCDFTSAIFYCRSVFTNTLP